MCYLSAQDTTIVQTFTLDSTSRAGVFSFPDEPNNIWEKIIMQYRMRCHDAQVGNGNVGCYEWDYHCSTVITDSSKTDSVWSTHPSYIISGSTSNPFEYINYPTFNYYLYTQKLVNYNTTLSEDSSLVGTGTLNLDFPFSTNNSKGKTQVLYLGTELADAGVLEGYITGIRLFIENAGSEVEFLKIKIKTTDKTELNNLIPDIDGFTEVYFLNTSFVSTNKYSFNFYNSFFWNGTDNLIFEFSFTTDTPLTSNQVKGHETTGTQTITTNVTDRFISLNQGDYIDVPAEAFNDLDSLITISFWQYGNPDFQPFNSYIFEGADMNNNRVINSHLPWGNSHVYWDAGNSGTSSYDRIEKLADFENFAGQWNHWAFTKDATSGEMKIYLNGNLWHSGTGLTRNMSGITKFHIAGSQNGGQYAGFINDFKVWKTVLDEQTIKDWMYKNITPDHPAYSDLLFYYTMDEISGDLITDASPNGYNGTIIGQPLKIESKGHQLNRNFEAFDQRPNIEIVQGSYFQTVTEFDFLDSLQRPNNTAYQFYVENNNLYSGDTSIFWEAGDMPVYDESGQQVDVIYIEPEGSLNIETLEYYQRWPSRIELLSFITPYGNGLDLGEAGKMWEFDVTDFGPVLNGDKFVSIEGVGKWSEELDIRFLFIEGTPVRDVLNIRNLWPITQSSQIWAGFSPAAIINNTIFEPRNVDTDLNAAFFKVRTSITGHGQTGEFSPKWHYLNIAEGEKEFEFKVWKECSTIPIFPQGGTWIFDRAGWCPGDPSNVYEFDLTDYMTAGQSSIIDYGLNSTVPFSNADYRISALFVEYGPANFSLDANLLGVVNPNSAIAAFERFNPACMDPEIIIQNTGSTPITNVEIEYSVEGGELLSYNWVGELNFLDSAFVSLPIPGYDFWLGTNNRFNVNIIQVNGTTDENTNNNTYSIPFESTDVYDVSVEFELHCLTNNYGFQNSYSLTDAAGNIIVERDDMENTTLYQDAFSLQPGCYKLRIDDSADNGLYFWYNTTQGSGYLRLKNAAGYILENIEPEFGRFSIYEFAVQNISGIQNPKSNIVSSIYPNPVRSVLNLDISGLENSNVQILIFDVSGHLVMEKSMNIYSSKFTHKLNIEQRPAGIYNLHLISGESRQVFKVVKL